MRLKVGMAAIAGLCVTGALAARPAVVAAAAREQAAAKPVTLGSVEIPRKVMANGQALAAGTYMVRLSAEMPTAVLGQSPDGARWVEFVQGSTVKGKEIATVLTKDDLKKMKVPAAPGVEVLRGNDYLRVWINHAGTNYLVHLATGK